MALSVVLAALAACGHDLPAQPVGIPEPRVERTDPDGPTAKLDALHATFGEMLQRHVRAERVDYLRWRDHDATALRHYLDRLAEVAIEALPQADRLAFYINLYNATMIDAILPRVDAAYTTSADAWSIFDAPLVRLGEQRFSLNHLEHQIIRKTFADPRIHTALVCGAVSCPPLSTRAYRGADLDAVLEANMRSFVNDGVRNVLDDGAPKLSKLFEWYAADFGGADAVLGYVARYAERSIETGADVAPRFLEYSWELNLAAPARGRFVRCVRAQDDLPVGALCEVVGEDGDRLQLSLPFGRGKKSVARDSVVAWP